MLTVHERALRRAGIGASDAPIVAGVSNYATPLDLYRDKANESSLEEIERLEVPLLVGNALEPACLALFEAHRKVRVIDRQRRVVDPERAWRWVTLDGRINDEETVEAKASSLYGNAWGEDEDAIPMPIHIQCQHNMACSGASVVWVPAILHGRTFRIYRVRRDQEAIDLLTQAEEDFIYRLANRIPPPARTLEDLKHVYPRNTKGDLVISKELHQTLIQHAELKARIKRDAEEVELLEFALKTYMGEHSALVDRPKALKPLATWKAYEETRVDIEKLRSEYRDVALACEKQNTVRKFLNKLKVKP